MKLLRPLFAKPVKYAAVGASGQALDYFLTILLAHALAPLAVANAIGYICGSIMTYIGHAKYTFSGHASGIGSPRQLVSFILTCLLGASAGYLVLALLVNSGILLEKAKLAQLAAIALVQYLLNYLFTFKKA